MKTLTVVCWMWTGERVYLPEHVNVLYKQFQRHLRVAHRFVCITDETDGFDPGIEVLRTPAAARGLANLRSPEGARMPACYRRLWVFSREAAAILGPRVLCVDVDMVIVGDITRLVERSDPFVGWRPKMAWGNSDRIAGGQYLMDTGAFTDVFEEFGADGIREARAAGYRGSDQAWISYKLRDRVALWDPSDGVYAVTDFKTRYPPDDARVVHFSGHEKPWHRSAPEWVRQYWPWSQVQPHLPQNDWRRLVLAHAGAKIAVMGGAPSLADDVATVGKADLWISVNGHGAQLQRPTYVVAMDERHDGIGADMREHVRRVTDAPIIGPWPQHEYVLTSWPGAPKRGLSGMVAVWLAWAMGAHPVIVCGMDGYDGSRLEHTKRMLPEVHGEVRVVSGPLQRFWPAYRQRERLGPFVEHTAHAGLMGMDGAITVRVRKPVTIRDMAVTPGTELSVMRHEVARLLHHRMVEEI